MDTNQPYVPINCHFHDLLEILATTGEVVPILFHGDEGGLQACTSKITDVFSRSAVEFLATASGECIRLDRLVEVNGIQLANFPGEGAWCAS